MLVSEMSTASMDEDILSVEQQMMDDNTQLSNHHQQQQQNNNNNNNNSTTNSNSSSSTSKDEMNENNKNGDLLLIVGENNELNNHRLSTTSIISESEEDSSLDDNNNNNEKNVPPPKIDPIQEERQKKLNKRKLVIQEILQTEKEYVRCLKILDDIFITPIRQQHLLTDEDCDELFSDLVVIIKVNMELLGFIEIFINYMNNNNYNDELDEMLKNSDLDTKKRAQLILAKKMIPTLGDIFQLMGNYLISYASYCNKYEKLFQMIEEKKEKKSKFRKFLEKVEFTPESNNDTIVSFMIKPVQRIPRYELLLRESIKNTPQDHHDYQRLTSAANKINTVASKVNEKIKLQLCSERLIQLEKQIINLPFDLLKANRKFIKHSIVGYISDGKGVQLRLLILFNDLILLCYPKMDVNNNSLNSSNSDGNNDNYHGENNDNSIMAQFLTSNNGNDIITQDGNELQEPYMSPELQKREIEVFTNNKIKYILTSAISLIMKPLPNIEILKDNYCIENGFKLNTRDKTFIFFLENSRQLNVWVNLINEQIEKLKRQLPNLANESIATEKISIHSKFYDYVPRENINNNNTTTQYGNQCSDNNNEIPTLQLNSMVTTSNSTDIYGLSPRGTPNNINNSRITGGSLSGTSTNQQHLSTGTTGTSSSTTSSGSISGNKHQARYASRSKSLSPLMESSLPNTFTNQDNGFYDNNNNSGNSNGGDTLTKRIAFKVMNKFKKNSSNKKKIQDTTDLLLLSDSESSSTMNNNNNNNNNNQYGNNNNRDSLNNNNLMNNIENTYDEPFSNNLLSFMNEVNKRRVDKQLHEEFIKILEKQEKQFEPFIEEFKKLNQTKKLLNVIHYHQQLNNNHSNNHHDDNNSDSNDNSPITTTSDNNSSNNNIDNDNDRYLLIMNPLFGLKEPPATRASRIQIIDELRESNNSGENAEYDKFIKQLEGKMNLQNSSVGGEDGNTNDGIKKRKSLFFWRNQ
ncbi:hypothetical protein ABK040_001405 [Willaertia magna]